MLAAGVRNSAAVVIGQGGAEGMNGDAFAPNRIAWMPDLGLHVHACGMTFLPQARPGQAELVRPTTLCELSRSGVSGL